MVNSLLALVRLYERSRAFASVYERSREIVTGLLRALEGQPAISA